MQATSFTSTIRRPFALAPGTRAFAVEACLSAAVLMLGGCTAEIGREQKSDVDVDTPAVTHCGEVYYSYGEKVVARDEWYSFRKMNAELADDGQLRGAVGFDRVDSCDRARAFNQRKHEYLESQPSEAPAPALASNSKSAAGIGTLSQAIRGGTPTSRAGVVRLRMTTYDGDIWSCTGNLLSKHVILTAAHCIPDGALYEDTNGDEMDDYGSTDMMIEYDRPATGGTPAQTYCLTAPTDVDAWGACANSEKALLVVRRHKNYNGFGDTADDVGLILRTSKPWGGPAGSSSSDWLKVNSGGLVEGAEIRPVGQGLNDAFGDVECVPYPINYCYYLGSGEGVVRQASINNIDYLGGNHLMNFALSKSLCEGDSGGPALERVLSSIAGVASNFDLPDGSGTIFNPAPACALDGDKQRWSRLSGKITWLNGVLASHNLPQCVLHAASGSVTAHRCY